MKIKCYIKYKLLILLVLFTSCARTSVSEKKAEDLKNDIKVQKDTESFFWLESYYESSDHPEEIMPYSLVLTKDSSKIGCYSFYEQYLKILNSGKFDRKNFYKLENQERRFLIYILNKGALNDDENCQDELFFTIMINSVMNITSIKQTVYIKYYLPLKL